MVQWFYGMNPNNAWNDPARNVSNTGQFPQPQFPPVAPAGANSPYPLQPTEPPAPPPKKSPAALIAISVIVLLVVIVGALAYFGGSNDGPTHDAGSKDKMPLTPGQQQTNSTVVSHNDGKLDLAQLIDPQTAATEPQALDAKLNQQVNLNDGASFMVTKVTRNWTPPNGSLKAEAGKALVLVSVVVGNRASAADITIPADMFMMLGAAGSLLSPLAVTDSAALPDALAPQALAPGSQVKGSLVYQVAAGEQISLVVNRQYQNPTTQAVVAMNAQVTLE